MEILAISLSVAIVIFSFSVCALIRSKAKTNVKLPPGSFGWPVIGETVEFLFGKPGKFVGDRMKKYSPDIFKTKILGEKTAVICGPNGHKFLFANEQKLFNEYRPHSTRRIIRSNQTKAGAKPSPRAPPPEVDHQIPQTDSAKKLIRQPGFLKPEALGRFLGKMESICQQLLTTHWEGKHEVKVFPLAKMINLTISCRYFLGIDNPESISRFVDHFDNVTSGIFSIILNVPGTTYYRANKAAAAIRKELLSVIKEKKEAMAAGQPMQDILSCMIVVTDPSGKRMTDAQIADSIMGVIVAGYSTVAATITLLMKYIGESHHIYSKIRAEQMQIAASKKPGEVLGWEDVQKMKYSWNAVCETMRLNPPLQGTFREVLTDFTYAGYTIPKGWKVYWTPSSTNMNPAYFKDPETFDPSRYDCEEGRGLVPYTYVPFGGGPRLCPGKEYARLAILVFLHNVVQKYKWTTLFPDEKITGGMIPTPEKELPIRLHPASSP